jgi:hypothetical protein
LAGTERQEAQRGEYYSAERGVTALHCARYIATPDAAALGVRGSSGDDAQRRSYSVVLRV